MNIEAFLEKQRLLDKINYVHQLALEAEWKCEMYSENFDDERLDEASSLRDEAFLITEELLELRGVRDLLGACPRVHCPAEECSNSTILLPNRYFYSASCGDCGAQVCWSTDIVDRMKRGEFNHYGVTIHSHSDWDFWHSRCSLLPPDYCEDVPFSFTGDIMSTDVEKVTGIYHPEISAVSDVEILIRDTGEIREVDGYVPYPVWQIWSIVHDTQNFWLYEICGKNNNDWGVFD